MKVSYQLLGRCLWHKDCEKIDQGIMTVVEDKVDHSIIECLHCGKRAKWPIGFLCGSIEEIEHCHPTAKGKCELSGKWTGEWQKEKKDESIKKTYESAN